MAFIHVNVWQIAVNLTNNENTWISSSVMYPVKA